MDVYLLTNMNFEFFLKLTEDTQHGVHGVLAHRHVEMVFTPRQERAPIPLLNSMD